MTPSEPPCTVNECDSVRIRLASPQEIQSWSSGEVTEPATFAVREEWKCRCGRLQGSNHSEQRCETCGGPVKRYRSLHPTKGGLFCERVFGPLKDWECACGKLRGPELRGHKCEQCQVEVNESRVRRQRLGHIELAAPVVHTWYLQSRPSLLAVLLNLKPSALNQVLAFRAHVVLEPGNTPLKERQILDEEQFRRARQDHGESFRAGQGAEAIRELLRGLPLEELSRQLRAELSVLLRAELAPRSPGEKEGAESKTDDVRKRGARRAGLTRSEVEFLAALLRLRPADVRQLLSFRCLVVLRPGPTAWPIGHLLTDEEYRQTRAKHGSAFEAGTGPDALVRLLEQLDQETLAQQLQVEAVEGLGARLCRLGRVLGCKPEDLERILTGRVCVVFRPGQTSCTQGQLLSEEECAKQSADFRADSGAAALRQLLEPADRAERERLSVLLGMSAGSLDQVLGLKAYVVLGSGASRLTVGQVLSENEVRQLPVEAKPELATGAVAIQALLARLDLERLSRQLLQDLTADTEAQLRRLSDCLQLSTGSLVQVLSAQKYLVIDPGAADLSPRQLLGSGQARKQIQRYRDHVDPPRIATGTEAIQQLVECLPPSQRPANLSPDLIDLDERQTRRLAALLGLKPARLRQVLSFQRFVVIHPATSGLREGQLLRGEQYRKARRQHGDALQAATGGRAAQQLLALLDAGRLLDELRAAVEQAARCRLQRLSTLLNLELPAVEMVLSAEAYLVLDAGSTPLKVGEVLPQARWQEERRRHGKMFEAGTGSSALHQLLRRLERNPLRRAAVVLGTRPDLLVPMVCHEDYLVLHPGGAPLEVGQLLKEADYRAARTRFKGLEAVTGPEAVGALLRQQDLPALLSDLRERLTALSTQTRQTRQEEVLRQLRLVNNLLSSGTRPEWLVLDRLPVLPPDLRPIRPLPARRRAGEPGPARPPEDEPTGDADAWVANDLNYLYQRIIAVNNRIRRYLETGTQPVLMHHERRVLQQAVDALFDNAHCPQPMLGSNNQPLKSLSDLIQGKQGCFRQNLLGKRVDYSARSVIVVGPWLKLEQCGLPRAIALELFQPFVIRRLKERIERQLNLPDHSARVTAQLVVQSLLPRMNVKGREARVRKALLAGLTDRAPPSARNSDAEGEQAIQQAELRWARELLENKEQVVDDLLRLVMKEHLILLNRAPTLHRMNVQAFEPLLVPGKAIQLHPMVCEGFGADFDGDTMAVHLPLSIQARVEAETLMTPAANLLSPAHGRPIIAPSQDIVLGCYYLTFQGSGVRGQGAEPGKKEKARKGKPTSGGSRHQTVDTTTGEGMIFSGPDEVLRAHAAGRLGVHARIQVRLPAEREIVREGTGKADSLSASQTVRIETTVGRVLFDQVLPPGMPFYDLAMSKKNLARLLADCFERRGRRAVVALADGIKELGFREATRSGLSFVVEDLFEPSDKKKILAETEKAVRAVKRRCAKGELSDQQRYDQVIALWTDAQDRITQQLEIELRNDHRDGQPYVNAHFVMVDSGARSRWVQVRQLAALRGLMDRPSGARRTMEQPITSSLREGLGILEYFRSTHGARKAGADKAGLPDAGYLTRKLVDVAQHVFISMDDCGTLRGVRKVAPPKGKKGLPSLAEQVVGRCSLGRVLGPDSTVLIQENERITRVQAQAMEKQPVAEVEVRSPLTCEAPQGVCRRCYGTDLSTQALVEEGTPVGVLAAQSIGEPATQLAMKTKHTGGVAGVQSMVSALEHVAALFDAHQPNRPALLAPARGTVRLASAGDGTPTVAVEPAYGTERAQALLLPPRAKLQVKEGQPVEAGEPLTDDPVLLHEMLSVGGIAYVQGYLLRELQTIYRSNGVTIDDRHFEVIIAQMLHKVSVREGGDTELVPGAVLARQTFAAVNRRLRECVRIDAPHDSRWLAGTVVSKDLYKQECERLRAEGGQPPTHTQPVPARSVPLLLGITQAAIHADSFLSAASFQHTTQVLAEAALAGKEDPLTGLKENVILGRLVPAGTGSPSLRAAVLRLDDGGSGESPGLLSPSRGAMD